MPNWRKLAPLLALFIIVALAGAYYGGFLAQLGGANTTTKWNGLPNPPGTELIKFRGGFFDYDAEMLDSSQYVAALTSQDRSEVILARTSACKSGYSLWLIGNSPDGSVVTYDVRLNGRELKTGGFKYPLTVGFVSADCAKGEWFELPDLYTNLVGKETGVLTVDVSVWAWDALTQAQTGGGWYHIGHDEANIYPGEGSCSLASALDRPFKPGETVTARCNVGYASSLKETPTATGGWYLWGSWSDTMPVASLGPGPAFGKTVTFPAPSAAGIYTVTLTNALFAKDVSFFTVTVNPDQAPPAPAVSLSPAPPYQSGQDVTVSWSAQPNAATKSPIVEVRVFVLYSNGEAIKEVAGAARGSLSFQIGRDTDIKVSAVSKDANGEYSAPFQSTYTVVSCDLYNTCRNGGNEGDGFVFPIWAILVIAAALLVLAAVFLPFLFLDFRLRLVLILVAVILALAAFVVYPG